MGDLLTKPKLVFFQYKYGKDVPQFLLIHKKEHIKCLSENFDVKIITEDSDYQQICEIYKPDLVLFETGLQINDARQPIILNARANPEIPKLAFMNADAWGGTCARVISDMDRWGIEILFSNCVTAIEHIREISRSIFVWPNFIDSEVFRDYNEPKIIPIVLTGSTDPQYPWRHKVYKLLSTSYPSLMCPHLGYSSRFTTEQILVGQQYARTLNAAWFVPACGTVAKEIVRKHFEVPGSKACLITEKSAALVAAGFADFESCVFADHHDVIDKVMYLFKHQDLLQKIINTGHRLIHTRHTIKQRDQIYQWFMLFKNLEQKHVIVQTNPFEPLKAVSNTSQLRNSYISCDGLHLTHLHQAEKLLWISKYEEAERQYLECLNYTPSMAEARIGIGICNLYMGKPKVALSWIVPCIRETLSGPETIDPDPVQWAYLIICLICLGKLRNANRRAQQFPALHHLELDRVRFVVSVLTGIKQNVKSTKNTTIVQRKTLHQLPNRNTQQWVQEICNILIACERSLMANLLNQYMQKLDRNHEKYLENYSDQYEATKIQATKKFFRYSMSFLPKFFCIVPLRGFDNPLLLQAIKDKFGKIFHKLVKSLEENKK